jgi:hypothetical protein
MSSQQYSTGYNNTSVGSQSLLYNTTGTNNVSIGYSSMQNNKTGYANVAIGFNSGLSCVTGGYNTFLGFDTNVAGGDWSSSTAIGYNATIIASNQIVLGTPAETVIIPGNLNVLGTATCTSGWSTSDYRIKENVIKLNNNFTVDSLIPVTYKNLRSKKQDIGLIAHELQEHFPELVNGEKDGKEMQSVNYIGLIPILIKEIQDLKIRVNLIEDKNKSI